MQFITIDKQMPSAIVREELETLKQRIIANMYAANAVATGKTIKSMHVEMKEGNTIEGILYGRKCFGALETGRKPTPKGTPPSKPTLHDCIVEWCAAKGIRGKTPQETMSITWAISTAIHQNGTRLFQRGGRADIYSNEIPRTIKSVKERLMFLISAQVVKTKNSLQLNNVTIK